MPLWCKTPSVAAQSLNEVLDAPQQPAYQWFASTDPQNKNADYIELKPGETRRIPLAAGRLVRLWSTGFEPDKLVLALDNGEKTILLGDNKARHGTLFEKAYTLYPDESTLPAIRDLKSGAALVATNKSKSLNKWFYQVSVRPSQKPSQIDLGKTTPVKLEANTISPREERVLFEAAEDGVITDLALRFEPSSFQTLNDLRLQARWDENAPLAIDLPLPALLGQFFEAAPVEAAAFVRSMDTIVLRWPMPFAAGGQLKLVNGGDEAINLAGGEITTSATENPYRFHAHFGSARTQRGQTLDILRVSGAGALVGLTMGVAPAADTVRRTFAYLEGNETIIADGRAYEGTGTEDYFNSAWYYPEEPFSQPFAGVTFKGKEKPRVSMYRLMIPDAVPFAKTLDFQFEHGNGNNSNDLEYSWAAFWYQEPTARFEMEDALPRNAIGSDTESTPSAMNWDTLFNWAALGIALIVVVLGVIVWRARSSTRSTRGE